MASLTQGRNMNKTAPLTRKDQPLIDEVISALRKHNGCVPKVASMFKHKGKQLTKAQVMHLARTAGIKMNNRDAPSEPVKGEVSPERMRLYALGQIQKQIAATSYLDAVDGLPRNQQCKWAIEEHGKGDFSWCPNLRQSDAHSYCAHHESKARVKMKYGKESWSDAQQRKDSENELVGGLSTEG